MRYGLPLDHSSHPFRLQMGGSDAVLSTLHDLPGWETPSLISGTSDECGVNQLIVRQARRFHVA